MYFGLSAVIKKQYYIADFYRARQIRNTNGTFPQVLRRHQTSVVTKRPEPTTEMMRPDTGLHTNQTGQHIGKPGLNLAARPLLPQNNLFAAVLTNNVERVLTDIDPDNGNPGVLLRHGVLLVIGAPCQLQSLAGQEHGRTIPSADITNSMDTPWSEPIDFPHYGTGSERANGRGASRT